MNTESFGEFLNGLLGTSTSNNAVLEDSSEGGSLVMKSGKETRSPAETSAQNKGAYNIVFYKKGVRVNAAVGNETFINKIAFNKAIYDDNSIAYQVTKGNFNKATVIGKSVGLSSANLQPLLYKLQTRKLKPCQFSFFITYVTELRDAYIRAFPSDKEENYQKILAFLKQCKDFETFQADLELKAKQPKQAPSEIVIDPIHDVIDTLLTNALNKIKGSGIDVNAILVLRVKGGDDKNSVMYKYEFDGSKLNKTYEAPKPL
jgi:hypothetical protein